MMKHTLNKTLMAVVAMMAAAACNNNAQWSLEGNIAGSEGDDNVVVLEATNIYGK